MKSSPTFAVIALLTIVSVLNASSILTEYTLSADASKISKVLSSVNNRPSIEVTNQIIIKSYVKEMSNIINSFKALVPEFVDSQAKPGEWIQSPVGLYGNSDTENTTYVNIYEKTQNNDVILVLEYREVARKSGAIRINHCEFSKLHRLLIKQGTMTLVGKDPQLSQTFEDLKNLKPKKNLCIEYILK